jgi:hypothetical protein
VADLLVDVRKTLKIAFRMAGKNARHTRGRSPSGRTATRNDLCRPPERRPKKVVRIDLVPLKPALRTVHPNSQPVLVSRRNLTRPKRATRTVGIAQQYLRIVVKATTFDEGGEFSTQLLERNANNKIRKVVRVGSNIADALGAD